MIASNPKIASDLQVLVEFLKFNGGKVAFIPQEIGVGILAIRYAEQHHIIERGSQFFRLLTLKERAAKVNPLAARMQRLCESTGLKLSVSVKQGAYRGWKRNGRGCHPVTGEFPSWEQCVTELERLYGGTPCAS